MLPHAILAGNLVKEAHLPRVKTLEEFDFAQSPMLSAVQLHSLAQGGYIEKAEPIILIGDSGTGEVTDEVPADTIWMDYALAASLRCREGQFWPARHDELPAKHKAS